MAAIILAASRAIGETMIVMVSRIHTKCILDPTHSIQTLTGYIVQVSLGDAPHGTITYYSMYAVGATLFCLPLL